MVVPQANVFAIGDDISAEVAAALEPVGNAVHACSYGELAGRTVVVFGCGPIGCAAIAVARAEGAAAVIAVDRNRYRLELAERMGATHAGDRRRRTSSATSARPRRALTSTARWR